MTSDPVHCLTRFDSHRATSRHPPSTSLKIGVGVMYVLQLITGGASLVDEPPEPDHCGSHNMMPCKGDFIAHRHATREDRCDHTPHPRLVAYRSMMVVVGTALIIMPNHNGDARRRASTRLPP